MCFLESALSLEAWQPLALSTEPPSRLKILLGQTYFYLVHLFFPPWLAEYEKTSFLAPQPVPLWALSLLL